MYDFDITWPLNLVVLLINEGRRYQFNEIHLFEKIKKREARMKENNGASNSANKHIHHACCNYVRIIIVLHLIFHFFPTLSHDISLNWVSLADLDKDSDLKPVLSLILRPTKKEACRSSKWSPKLRPIKKRAWGGLNPNFCSL